MADILKITTPLVDRLPAQAVRPAADASVPFDLSNVTRVMQTQDPTEILRQNTGFSPGADTPRILADLLGDPAVSAAMIRSITLLEEFIGLLPGTKDSLTQEIRQLFGSLLLPPSEIAAELARQEETTTLFKGDLFNQLRALLAQSGAGSAPKPEIATDIGVLLKGLNATIGRGDALASIANNLSYLASSLDASPRLFERLDALVQAFRAPNAAENFTDLKQQVFAVLKDISQSVLFTPAMEKTLPLVVYNLSRFNDNENFLPDALHLLLTDMDGRRDGSPPPEARAALAPDGKPLPGPDGKLLLSPDGKVLPGPDGKPLSGPDGKPLAAPDANAISAKAALVEKLTAYLARYAPGDGARAARSGEEDSRVIDVLAKIINKSGKSEAPELISGDRFEKIVHSILSSPSNFTPLLHFIVPVRYEELRAFAEFWIDPNAGDGDKAGGGPSQNTHMLMVCDVEGIGRFECELFVQNRRLALNLLCPPAHVDDFKAIGPAIRGAVSKLGYSFESINVDRLERTHSLMEVFTELPHRRAGIDVKV